MPSAAPDPATAPAGADVDASNAPAMRRRKWHQPQAERDTVPRTTAITLPPAIAGQQRARRRLTKGRRKPA